MARLNVQKPFLVRQFNSTDLEHVMNINKRCLPENYSNAFYLTLKERFPATFLIAEEKGEVVGYIMCRIERSLSHFKLIGLAKIGHIISIAVLPEYQRQGIGYSLIRKASKAMSLYHAEECVLEVRKNNLPAIKLYTKIGFKVTRTLSGYYADGEDAYKMACKLPIELEFEKMD